MKSKDSPKKSQSSGIYILAILSPILIAALIFGLNVGGLRSRILDPVIKPGDTQQVDPLVELEEALLFKEKQLNLKEKELLQLDAQLRLKEEALILKEYETIQISEEAMDLRIQYFSHVQDLEAIVRLYEKMDPGNAANILALLPQENAVRILKGMKTDAAALILSEMPPLTAGQLTAVMLNTMWRETIDEKGGEKDDS